MRRFEWGAGISKTETGIGRVRRGEQVHILGIYVVCECPYESRTETQACGKRNRGIIANVENGMQDNTVMPTVLNCSVVGAGCKRESE